MEQSQTCWFRSACLKPLGSKTPPACADMFLVKALHQGCRKPVFKSCNPAVLSCFPPGRSKKPAGLRPSRPEFPHPCIRWRQQPFSQTSFVALGMLRCSQWPQARMCVCFSLFIFFFFFRHARGTSAEAGGLQSSIISPVPSAAPASASAITDTTKACCLSPAGTSSVSFVSNQRML